MGRRVRRYNRPIDSGKVEETERRKEVQGGDERPSSPSFWKEALPHRTRSGDGGLKRVR